jgi:hypothetical protein
MANWWDDAPLAKTTSQPKSDWFKDAPLAPGASVEGGRLNSVSVNKPAPSMSMPDALARGAAQGASFNFYDELKAAGAAGGAGEGEPGVGGFKREGLDQVIMGLAKYWFGDKDAESKYNEVVGKERAYTKKVEEERPGSYLAGNIAGAVAAPAGAVNAAARGARMAQGAVAGAVTGGLSGAGDGEGVADRAARAGSGAVVGGAVGAVIPPIVEGATALVRAGASRIGNAVRGVVNADDEAARRVALGLERDTNIDPNAVNRLTPQEFVTQQQAGNPVAIMDMGGDTTRALARSSANTSPEGRAALERTINDRFEGQTERTAGWFNRAFNYPNAHAQQQAIDQLERTVNRPGYERAYRLGDRDIMSPELERLLGAPAVADAMRNAVERGQNRAIVQGMGAFNPRVTVENGVVQFNRGANGAPAYPNLQLWDYTYRELRDAADRAFRSGSNEEGSALRSLAVTLRNELDTAVPAFGQARGVAAGFFRAENALEAGQNFVTQNFGNREARAAIARMNPLERKLFQDGFVSRYIEKINNSPDRRNVLNQIANSPGAREQIEIALGPQRARELEAFLRVEGLMELARPAVQGNSTTARQLAELGLAGGTYTVGTGGNVTNPDASAIMNAALVYGAARGRNVINERVSRRVGEMLASQDPQHVLRGIQIVTNNRQMFNSLRSADAGLARIGGSQSSGVPALQSMGIGRADDEPNVPRPPGQ